MPTLCVLALPDARMAAKLLMYAFISRMMAKENTARKTPPGAVRTSQERTAADMKDSIPQKREYTSSSVWWTTQWRGDPA